MVTMKDKLRLFLSENVFFALLELYENKKQLRLKTA